MKKLLLATTVLVSLGAASAFADAPTIKATGKIDGQMGFGNQKVTNSSSYWSLDTTDAAGNFNKFAPSNYNSNGSKVAPTNFNVRTEVGLRLDGMTDAGINYGGLILFENLSNPETDPSTGITTTTSDTDMKRSYLFAATSMGKLELGANEGAEETMKIGADTIAVGTGGIDGDYMKYMNTSGSVLGQVNGSQAANAVASNSAGTVIPTTRGWYLLAPSVHGMHDSKLRRANKVTYYTPTVAGFQAGISYAPNYNAHGDYGNSNKFFSGTVSVGGTTVYPTFTNQMRDIVSGGITYTNQFNDVGVAASVTGVSGTAKKVWSASGLPTNGSQSYRNLKAVAGGLKLTYRNFSLAGSYGNLGKSSLRKDLPNATTNCIPGTAVSCLNSLVKTKTNYYYTVGGAYSQGPVAASVTYLGSNRWGNKAGAVSVGVDYMLAPGFTPYAEYTNFTLKSTPDYTTLGAPRTKTTGNVVIVGTKFRF